MARGNPSESLGGQRINVTWDVTVSPQRLYKGREKIVERIAIYIEGSVVGLGTELFSPLFI